MLLYIDCSAARAKKVFKEQERGKERGHCLDKNEA